MNIHEYQAKQLLRRYGVPVPRGDVAHTPQEAEAVAEELDGPVWVVKAQIHAGGRGKAGGIKICRSVKEPASRRRSMIAPTAVPSRNIGAASAALAPNRSLSAISALHSTGSSCATLGRCMVLASMTARP